jgi:hypothetical protein
VLHVLILIFSIVLTRYARVACLGYSICGRSVFRFVVGFVLLLTLVVTFFWVAAMFAVAAIPSAEAALNYTCHQTSKLAFFTLATSVCIVVLSVHVVPYSQAL